MEADHGRPERVPHLDNLKWVLVAGVILAHAAMAYGAVGSGAWFYVEPSLSSLTQVVLKALIGVGLLFALGTFCLVAGLLTPPALARKGDGPYLRGRLLRLGIPVLAYLVLVTPAIEWLVAETAGPPETVGAVLRHQLGQLDTGPLWFAVVLLLFTACYVGWRRVQPARGPGAGPLRLRHLMVAAGLVAALSFLIRLAYPMGSYQPVVTHLWLLPQLAVLFALGLVARERGWLAGRPSPLLRRVCWLAPLVALAVLEGTLVATGSVQPPYQGGWHWQAAVMAGVEGVVAVGVSLALFDLFQRAGRWRGKLAGALSRDSYFAYFLQAPVLVVLELALSRLAWPGEVKLALTAAVGVAACFALAWAVRYAVAAAAGRQGRATNPQTSQRRELPQPPVGC